MPTRRSCRPTGVCFVAVLLVACCLPSTSQDPAAVAAVEEQLAAAGYSTSGDSGGGPEPTVHFHPTEDWQEVGPEHIVPEHCDVKLDLKNNKQYARLPVKAPEQPTLQPVESDVATAADEYINSPEARAAAVGKMYHILMGLPEPPAELEADTMYALTASNGTRHIPSLLFSHRCAAPQDKAHSR
eukprot:COSAG05_NODE_469_length_9505_cov_14.573676_5_plen_185_part_00